jgi:hypothetical protein
VLEVVLVLDGLAVVTVVCGTEVVVVVVIDVVCGTGVVVVVVVVVEGTVEDGSSPELNSLLALNLFGKVELVTECGVLLFVPGGRIGMRIEKRGGGVVSSGLLVAKITDGIGDVAGFSPMVVTLE